MGLKIGVFGTLASIFSDTCHQNFAKFLPLTDHYYCSHAAEKNSKIVLSEVSQKCEKPQNLGFGAVCGSPTFTQFQVTQYLKMFTTY